MSQLSSQSDKPQRLNHKTYLQLIHNSVGTEMFRNFYIRNPDGSVSDAMDGGKNSCAFYVSGVLTMFAKVHGIHGTVAGTKKDLEESGWKKVADDKQPGDVLVWEALEQDDGEHEHIGFYIGGDKAVSTSGTQLQVIEHDIRFGETNRAVTAVYRLERW